MKVVEVNPSRICGALTTIVKVASKLSSNEMHILTQKFLYSQDRISQATENNKNVFW